MTCGAEIRPESVCSEEIESTIKSMSKYNSEAWNSAI
jgi:hypothetical protein